MPPPPPATPRAQANPVHRGTLIGVLPIVHRGLGCIGLALSTNGQQWSPPTPLKRCEVHGKRTEDHPVAGVALVKGEVVLLLHEFVPGITFDQATPSRWRTAFARVGGLDWGKSGLVRYSVPCDDFAAWTARALASLAADGDAMARAMSDRGKGGLYICAPAACKSSEG